MGVLIFVLLIYPCFLVSDPAWTVYPPNVMYSGQYRAFVALASPKNPGTLATVAQPIYRNDVPSSSYFTQPPNVMLSLMGLKQMPPTESDTFVGFDVQLITNSTTYFYTIHNIYGVQMTYLIYMYLTLAQSNTDFIIGYHTQTFDMAVANKSYSFDVANKAGETYANFGTNKIEMKGFLAGYKMKQGTANGMFLNFTLKTKDASSFTITVSVNSNSSIQKIWYYRIGYDRTAIQKRTYTDIFRDFNYELINNVNTKDSYNSGFAPANEFQYRNYLTGANFINIAGTGMVSVEFVLYYYFAQNLALDTTTPFKLNPAQAQYLMGDTFYHAIRNCAAVSSEINYFISDRKCYNQCPDYSRLDASTPTCLPCHSTCLTCVSASQTACKSCNSALKRVLNDPDSDQVGDCVCSSGFYEDTSTGTCKNCSNGCLRCTNSGGVETCTSCNTTANFEPSNGVCVCASGYAKNVASSNCMACHFSCKTCSVNGVADKCLTCNTASRNFDSASNKCLCPSLTFDDGTNLACPSCHFTCLTCVSASKTACKSCNSTLKRLLNDPDSDQVGDCVCSSGFYEDSSTGICKSCSNGCLGCTNSGGVETCLSCNGTLNLQLINGQCKCKSNSRSVNSVCALNTCGDGIMQRSQQCDDNNILNGDGCSDSCQKEPDHECVQNSSLSDYSICYYNGSILMTITDVKKQAFSNIVSLSIKIDTTANSLFLKSYLNQTSSIVLEDIARRMLETNWRYLNSQTLQIRSSTFNQDTKMLQVNFQYFAEFDITAKKIRFLPSLSTSNDQIKYFFNSPEAIVHLQKPYNKIDIKYFDPDTYQVAKSLSNVFMVLVILFWIISLVFIGIKKANIAAEMMIVFQLIYVSLLSQGHLQIMLGGLSLYGKYTAGFNYEFFPNETKCISFTAINLECSLINNLNITFAIMLFILLAYVALKLTNQILNYCEERTFVKNRHERYMKNNNEQTNENIDPNQGPNFNFDMSSESSQAIQQNYYKQKEFIPEKVYNILLDLQYFFMFITVIIWVLSMSYTNQNTLSSTIEGSMFAVLYLLMLVFWFIKYKISNFSFVQAHKQSQSKYQEEEPEMASQNEFENGINLRMQEAKQKKSNPKRKRFSSVIFKALFYPLVWLALLGIGVILGTTQSIGYVTEAIVIAGSLLLALIIWVTQIYKEKLNGIRAIINCLILVVIEVFYIASQKNMLTATGLPVAIIVIILLSLTLISNSASTFYLFRIELRLAKRKEELKARSNIDNQIDKLQIVKKQKNNEMGGLFFKKGEYQSSLGQFNVIKQTVSNNKYGNNPTYPNQNSFLRPQSQHKVNQTVQKLSKQEINQMLSQSKLQKSSSFVHQSSQEMKAERIQGFRLSGPTDKNQQDVMQTSQKKKLFGYNPSKDFYSPSKSAATTKHMSQFSDTCIKMDFTPNKY